ncbi:MAG: ribosomal protein S18-alanine N-acetyltransferase [Candidatus Marinimicrobia bacterium]|nr:ribosomal protein S18-alanine N-acetyltransferase [Candidatus Neomarinimicrobiota bacterium]
MDKTKKKITLGDVSFRPMRMDDLDRVLEIEQQCYIDPWHRDNFEYEISVNSVSKMMVLEIKDTLVGYMGLWILPPEIHITNLAVAPDYRFHGLGSYMLEYVIHLAYDMRIKQITLEVRHNNMAALALYRKFGFEIKGIRKNYYAAEKAHALIMSRTVR